MAEVNSNCDSENGFESWSDMGIGFAIYMMKGVGRKKRKRPVVLDYWHGDLSHLPAMIQQDMWPHRRVRVTGSHSDVKTQSLVYIHISLISSLVKTNVGRISLSAILTTVLIVVSVILIHISDSRWALFLFHLAIMGLKIFKLLSSLPN